jgi:hypothetical protein
MERSERNPMEIIVMCDIEIKAEVFRVIRANSDKTPKQIMALLREHLPDVGDDELREAISSLYT